MQSKTFSFGEVYLKVPTKIDNHIKSFRNPFPH